MIRVMIADDHSLIREGLNWVISQSTDIEIVCEAASGTEIMPQLRKNDVDVLLLDISMPGSNFLDTMHRIYAELPDVKVLVLSTHPEESYALRSIDAGAKGYLTKRHSSEELAKAIRHIYRGNRYITKTLAELLLKERDTDHTKLPHEKLTNREYEILCMLGSGKRLKDIATELSLSPKTISAHRSHILEKLNLKTTGELIRYAIEHRITQ
jgi:DNA-binding NarL/FixJ family response regulator